MKGTDKDKMEETISCIGCGAAVPSTDGPTHAYIGASPGCCSLRRSADQGIQRLPLCAGAPADGRTYAVQHPGKPERRAIQSVAVHLIGFRVTLERGFDNERTVQMIKNAADRSSAFFWLEPPASVGTMTILDVLRAGDDGDEHRRLVTEWARCTWAAWASHHAQVHQWASIIENG